MMTTNLTREVCGGCLKSISLGQAIVECCECDRIIHYKCMKLKNSTGDFYCKFCTHLAVVRYNPFRNLLGSDSNPTANAADENIEKISGILENCKSYTADQMNKSHLDTLRNNTSAMFITIDGNRSNFDQLTVELERYPRSGGLMYVSECSTGAGASRSRIQIKHAARRC